MAINVLGIKYPYSEISMAVKSELDAIDPSDVKLSDNAKKIVKKQAQNVLNSDSKILELKQIDIKIANLLYERDAIILNLKRESMSAVYNVFNFTYDFASKVYEEFNDNGFSSAVVINAVKKVRSALFNDTTEKFKQIVCTDISFGGDDAELMFYFEHEPSGKCFRIDIPTLGIKADGQMNNYASDRSDTGPVFGICIVYPKSHTHDLAISYSYDIRIVREQLRLFIERDFESIPDNNENYICSRYICSKNNMSEADYIREWSM